MHFLQDAQLRAHSFRGELVGMFFFAPYTRWLGESPSRRIGARGRNMWGLHSFGDWQGLAFGWCGKNWICRPCLTASALVLFIVLCQSAHTLISVQLCSSHFFLVFSFLYTSRFPTGLGALLVRVEAVPLLRKGKPARGWGGKHQA